MSKKLIATFTALVAFAAIALPATASASPVLTEAGVRVATGAGIKALNEGNLVFTGGFNLTCSSAAMAGTVTENSGTSVKMTIPSGALLKGTAAGEDCTSALGPLKWTFNSEMCLATTKTANQFEINGCEGKVVTFSLAITGSVTCKYETAKILGTFTTSPAEAKLTIANQPVSGESTNSFICPSTGELDMAYRITTSDGTGLTFS